MGMRGLVTAGVLFGLLSACDDVAVEDGLPVTIVPDYFLLLLMLGFVVVLLL